MNEQLKIIISAEVDKLKKGVADAKAEIENLKTSSGLSSEDIDNNFNAIGESVKGAASKIGTAIAAAGVALAGIAVATKDYQKEQAKLNAAFETAGASADTAKQVYNDLYRVLGEDDTAVEAANHLAKLTTNQEELSEWTNICQGVYATFGASLPIEGLTEAANETAKVGTVTGSLADALNWAGISEDAFNEKLAACNTEAEREKLIRETLNGIYNEASANYEKNAADVLAQNEAQAKLQSALSAVGEAILPVITAFTQFGAEALALVLPHIQQLADQYLPTLKGILEGVTTAMQSAFEWASQHKELLAGIAIVVGTVTTAVIAYNAAAAIKAAMAAAEVTSVMGLVAAYAAQAVAMAAALLPYIAITAAIAAVIAIIVLCVKHWDEIKAKVAEVWSAIKDATEKAVNAVKEKFENMKAAISEKVEAIKTAASQKFEAIKTAISEKVEAAKTAVSNKFNAIKTAIGTKIDEAKTAASTKFEAVKTAIGKKVDGVKTKVTTVFNAVKTAITKPVEAAKTAVKKVVDKIKGFFNFSWSLPSLKVPKFSISPSGWKVGDLLKGDIPKLSVAWHAQGGVFDKPTLFNYAGALHGLGENGAEAIVPLEKNTQWLDKIADKLAAKQSNTPIVLTVDGKVFAQTSIDTINALTRQRGSLGLNVV